MPLTNAQNNILRAAGNAFAKQTGFKLDIVDETPAEVRILIKRPEFDEGIELEPLVLLTGGPTAVKAMITLLCRSIEKPTNQVLVFPQITTEMADKLRQEGIQFIDTAGNGYINQPLIYLFLKGNKAQNVADVPTTPRAFKQTGLRVLYALLCNPGMENETYRTIAAKTKVALGMVNWVVKDLHELGFLIETGAGRARQVRLIQKERLLDRWITAYAEQLRPKLVLGRYQGAGGWWQQAVLKPEDALWGGEVAAAKLTDYLKPQTLTVYADRDNQAAVIIPNRLKKDPQGDVELIARFWQPETVAPHGDMVHPLLVYADLMASGNQRNIETARMIYDQHIVQLVRED